MDTKTAGNCDSPARGRYAKNASDLTFNARVARLESIATTMRRNVVDMVYTAQSGHIGGALSAADFVTALYFDLMAIDPATRSSLEIEKSTSGSRDGSLLGAIDRTITAPGARLLASRLARPLLDPAAIDARLDAIEWFCERRPLRAKLRDQLRGMGDMARALSRLALGRGGPRDLGSLKAGLAGGEAIFSLFAAPEPLDPAPAGIAFSTTISTPFRVPASSCSTLAAC